nr:4Fe-4S binding protein [Fuerstiella marisgermanici]
MTGCVRPCKVQFPGVLLVNSVNSDRFRIAGTAMTISMTDYFQTRKADRKKETRYINVINKDSCTSCNSCATVCPVDCIYEVVSPVPSESYHQIDTSRCIGCQMCYRSPNDSSDFYQLTICPWNAIDMLHNPNVKPADQSVLEPYYRGSTADIPWTKLEEYSYQLFLDGEVFIPAGEGALHAVFAILQEESWMYSEEDNIRLVGETPEKTDTFTRYRATEAARDLLDVIFDGYERIFMD